MSLIVHVCLNGPFSDGLSYQENLLTKYHKKLGFDVTVLTSHYCWNEQGKIAYDSRNEYFNADGVKVIRLDASPSLIKKTRKYKHLFSHLVSLKPDILFVHGCNFGDVTTILKFLKHNRTKAYFDNHCDETNSATNWLSKNILHKQYWRHKVLKLVPYVRKFYGVLPSRCEFLKKMYAIPDEKVDLLVMGLDDEMLVKCQTNIGLPNNYLSIGGKIDAYKAKQTIAFIRAFNKLKEDSKYSKYKLMIYGSIEESFKNELLSLCNDSVVYFGWASQEEIASILFHSLYCVFPGRHSVLWEESVCLGKPIVVKQINGYGHVDIGGNVTYLSEESAEYYLSVLKHILRDDVLRANTKNAMSQKRFDFLYSKIARLSIEYDYESSTD